MWAWLVLVITHTFVYLYNKYLWIFVPMQNGYVNPGIIFSKLYQRVAWLKSDCFFILNAAQFSYSKWHIWMKHQIGNVLRQCFSYCSIPILFYFLFWWGPNSFYPSLYCSDSDIALNSNNSKKCLKALFQLW